MFIQVNTGTFRDIQKCRLFYPGFYVGVNCQTLVILVQSNIMTSLKPTDANNLLHQFIRSIPFLKDANVEEIGYLCKHSEYIDLRRFEIVYHKSEPSKALYYVCNGMIKISAHQNMGKEVIRTICHAGMIFGEGSLSGEKVRSAMSQSLDRRTTIIQINAEALRKILATEFTGLPRLI